MDIRPKNNRLRVISGSSNLNKTTAASKVANYKKNIDELNKSSKIKMNIQLFAEKDILRQSSNSLKKRGDYDG